MRSSLGAAIIADGLAGSTGTSGADQLESVVANTYEKMLQDKTSAFTDKINQVLPDFEAWVLAEPSLALNSHEQISDVMKHTTFRRLQASILTSCVCNVEGGDGINDGSAPKSANILCPIHAEHVQLSDLVYEITAAVHTVFTDKFMCFTQLMKDRAISGW